MHNETRRFLIFSGLLLSIGINILFLWVFYTAWMNPDKTANVHINDFGEAMIEAWVVVPLVFVFIFFCLALAVQELVEIKRSRLVEVDCL